MHIIFCKNDIRDDVNGECCDHDVHREDGLRHFANDEVPVSQVGEHLNSQWFLKTRFSKARFSKTRFSMVFKAKWKNTLFLSKLTILPKQCL